MFQTIKSVWVTALLILVTVVLVRVTVLLIWVTVVLIFEFLQNFRFSFEFGMRCDKMEQVPDADTFHAFIDATDSEFETNQFA